MRADENFLRTVATLPVGKAFLKAIETMTEAASWHEQQEGKLDQLKVKSGEAASWVLCAIPDGPRRLQGRML